MNIPAAGKRLIAGLLSVAAILGGCGDSPQLPKIAQDDVILAFGDSLTHGSGAAEGESYPDVLAQLTGRTVINAGVPGEVSADGLARLPAMLDEHQPVLLILCHGANDILRRFDTVETSQNIDSMIRVARERGIEVMMLGVPQFGLFLNAAPFYGEVAEKSGVPYLDAVIPEVLGDRSLKSDTVHPNAAGYRIIAEAVHQGLRDAGAL